MKKTVLLLLVVFSIQLFSQSIPSEFSWKKAPTTNGNKNFITSVRGQPYQGPCLSFAFIAAIESKYAIENNINNPSLELSTAYLDYKVYSSNVNSYKDILENGFKIPIKNGINRNFNTFPPNCHNELDCNFLRQTRNCINHSQGEKNYSFSTISGIASNGLEYIEDTVICQGPIGNYMTVKKVKRLLNINSNNDLKLKLLNQGPVIIKVNGLNNLNEFRNYGTNLNINYHAFTIIGWTKDSRWIIKDSWPSSAMAGIVKTKKNIDMVGLLNSNSIELYQVSEISYNGTTSQNPATISITPELSAIHADIGYVNINGHLYHKFWVTSNTSVDNWDWSLIYPNGFLKRNQVNMPYYSSVLLSPTSPTSSDLIIVKVKVSVNGRYVNRTEVTKVKNINLSNLNTTGNINIE